MGWTAGRRQASEAAAPMGLLGAEIGGHRVAIAQTALVWASAPLCISASSPQPLILPASRPAHCNVAHLPPPNTTAMQAAQTMRTVQCRPAAGQRRGLARPQRAALAVPRAQQQQGRGPVPGEAAEAVAQAAAAAEQQAAALADVAAQALEAEQQQQDEVAVAVSETAYAAQAPSEQQAAQHAVAAPPPPAGPGGLPIGQYLSHPGVRIAGEDGWER